MKKETVFVNELTNGVLDPNQPMLGPVINGGTIVANTAPGCWGPMITPELKGGHEVTRPVFVDGAEPGDSIAIFIQSIDVTSDVTASGSDRAVEGRFIGDPFIAGKCPTCDIINPKTVLKGVGRQAVTCAKCGNAISPFELNHGYTIAFNEKRNVGLTLTQEAAEKAAHNAKRYMALPDASIQNPIVTFAPHEVVGTVARLKPFIGQLGTTPSIAMPDSHNAGDFGAALINAPHDYALTEAQLAEHRTDGHMDINKIREGAIVICPVKVKGGGIYVGDVHAMQGEGEIAGHTCDVSAVVTLKVKLLKGVKTEGPIVIPREEDLPYLAKPITQAEMNEAKRIGEKWNVSTIESSAPISFVGTGADLNKATDNALARAATMLDVPVDEIQNRTTITGAVEIGRYPGTILISFLAPIPLLKKAGLYELIAEHYNLTL